MDRGVRSGPPALSYGNRNARLSRNRAPSRKPSSKVSTTLSGEAKSQADTGTGADGQT